MKTWSPELSLSIAPQAKEQIFKFLNHVLAKKKKIKIMEKTNEPIMY